MNVRAVVAEAIGTFILVFVGSLGVATVFVITNGEGSPIVGLLSVPFAFSLALMAAIAICGGVSGGHFNPAVTLAALFDGRLTWVDAVGYVVAQVVGALAASIAILLTSSIDVVAATVTLPGPTAADAWGLAAALLIPLVAGVSIAVVAPVLTGAPRDRKRPRTPIAAG